MIKKVSEEKLCSDDSRQQGDKSPAKKDSGILVQDLGQLQRTCQELERQLARKTEELKQAQNRLKVPGDASSLKQAQARDILDAICEAEAQYLLEDDPDVLFDGLHRQILSLTDSEYGFIGEVHHTAEGAPYLKTHAITNIAWDEKSTRLHEKQDRGGMEFHNMETLFGRVIVSGEPLIANDPKNDPRGGGLPQGHPGLLSFLGLPLKRGGRTIGMVGLANRPGGYDAGLIDHLQPFLSTCAMLIAGYQDRNSRREAERALADYRNQLVHSEKLSSFGKLNASIAHELNNPIYGIRNVLEKVLESVAMPQKHRDFVALAIKECNRIKNLLEKLQNLHKPSDEKLEQVQLHKIIDEMLLLTQKRLNEKKIEIDRRYARGLPTVPAIADQLKQVILNLLQNAEEAIPPSGGKITISTVKDGDRVHVCIRDTGSGFHPGERESLFAPFFTTKSGARGTGLGLAVSRSIIRAHGGEITATSLSEMGSEFTVILPI